MHLRLFLILPHENRLSGSSHADHPRLTFSENLPDPLQVQRHNYARLQRPNRDSEPSWTIFAKKVPTRSLRDPILPFLKYGHSLEGTQTRSVQTLGISAIDQSDKHA